MPADALVWVALAILDRHGFAAGATDTGKAKTLQLVPSTCRRREYRWSPT